MSRSVRHRRHLIFPVAVAMAAALTMSGCAAGQISQTADQVAAIDGANATVGDLGVRNAQFATPAGQAWKAGTDVPLLFWVTNDGLSNDTLTQVSTPAAASVVISGEAVVPGSTHLEFGTDSKVTVTLKGLAADLPYGISVPVTFVFAKAGQLTTNVPVQVPAERSGDRPTVDILVPEPTPLWETGKHEAAGG